MLKFGDQLGHFCHVLHFTVDEDSPLHASGLVFVNGRIYLVRAYRDSVEGTWRKQTAKNCEADFERALREYRRVSGFSLHLPD
ncbi:hypothetical protein AB0G06_43580 [Nonomuraea dietziae]|uniref:hypothetical protein n=1 Tax=Nonomuraea dietziae TaxID=65515 RepID=UPI0033F19A66